MVDFPAARKSFFMGAEVDRRLPPSMLAVQPLKPVFEALKARGNRVETALSGTDFDLGLCLLSKHKRESLARLGEGWLALRPGGVLLAAGRNDCGVGSLWRAFLGLSQTAQSLSKHHGKVFWATKTTESQAFDGATRWKDDGDLQVVPDLAVWSQPGIYNWDSVDRGSALLARHLPSTLKGAIADVGAGWGYLARAVLQQCPHVNAIDMFEADRRAVLASTRNVTSDRVAIVAHWHDVTIGLPASAYDAVVMNPPFHDGKTVDFDLGKRFITAASAALKPGGRLFMVANRQLPYEETLQAALGNHERLTDEGGYKVLTAQRRAGRRP